MENGIHRVTAHRRPRIPFSDAPQGTCRWCGQAILHETGPKKGKRNNRRRWHQPCVDTYNESDPREARRSVRKRDRGHCANCHIDTYALRRKLKGRGSHRKLRELGFKPRMSLWELDHIVPLIDGGGHEPANLQTLCTPCHKAKTAREASARRAVTRVEEENAILARADKLLADSEKVLTGLGV